MNKKERIYQKSKYYCQAFSTHSIHFKTQKPKLIFRTRVCACAGCAWVGKEETEYLFMYLIV